MGLEPNGGNDQEPGFMEHIRTVADALIGALGAVGSDAAGVIRTARNERLSEPEELLVLRSVLVSTRPEWEALADEELRTAASAALTAAKTHAIELEG